MLSPPRKAEIMTTTHDIDTPRHIPSYTDFPSPLALSPTVYRRAAQMAAEIAAAYYETRGQRAVYTPPPPETLQFLRTLRLPEQGMSAEDILAFFAESIMPYDMGNQVETFSAWVNPAAAPI